MRNHKFSQVCPNFFGGAFSLTLFCDIS